MKGTSVYDEADCISVPSTGNPSGTQDVESVVVAVFSLLHGSSALET